MKGNQIRFSPNFWAIPSCFTTTYSTGLYRLSAGEVNLELQNVTFHPLVQHTGDTSGPEQCFCMTRNDIPTLLQSLLTQVVQSGSKAS